MNLKTWCEKDEKNSIALRKQYLNFNLGLKYSKEKIKKLEKESEQHALLFLKKFRAPELLYDACIGGVVGSNTYELDLKLHEERAKKISTKKHKYKGQPVNWNNWRQFVVHAPDKARKQVFDEFIKKTPKITPIINKKFTVAKKIYSDYCRDPLTEYLQEHHMTLKQLEKAMTQLRDGVQKPFQKQFKHYSNKLFDKEPEYYDDFYFVRNALFRDMTQGFKKINPEQSVKKAMKEMGLNPNKVQVDDKDRPKKYASPFCMAVHIPDNVWVSYKAENPVEDATSVYHEFGHAIHFNMIDPKKPYWTKNIISNGLAETFSIFFDHFMMDKEYLTKRLKLDPDYADELIRRHKFSNLFSIAFYTGNSLFRIKYWKDKMKFKDCDKAYARELKKSMGMNIPGQYWKLHHILPESLMYVPSYMLASVQQHNLMRAPLEKKYGKTWWKNKKSGKLVKELAAPGADSRAAKFSKLNIKQYLKTLK